MPYASPPATWDVGAVPVGSDVYAALFGPDVEQRPARVEDILVWHWCPSTGADGRWVAWTVSNHTLVSADPLHLEPSLLWPCCGRHGFIRGGVWTDA